MTTAAFDGAGHHCLCCALTIPSDKGIVIKFTVLIIDSSFIGLHMGLSYPADEQQNEVPHLQHHKGHLDKEHSIDLDNSIK